MKSMENSQILGVKPLEVGSLTGNENSAAVFALLRKWVALLLAVQQDANLPKGTITSACTASRRVKLTRVQAIVRALVCSAWLEAHGGSPELQRMALAWLQLVYRVKPYQVNRWIAARGLEEQGPRAARAAARARDIEATLLAGHVHAAIEAGWIGCETRSARPWRAESHLRAFARRLLPVESR